MAKINGTLYLLTVGGDAIGATTNCTLSYNADLPETTTKDSGGWAEHLQGLRSAEGSIEGLYDPTETYGLEEILSAIQNRTDLVCELIASTAAGSLAIEFNASWNNAEITMEMENPVGISASFTVNGTPTERNIT